VYNRYAESARTNWALNFANADPAHRAEWSGLLGPTGIGLILRSIRTDYKFPMKWPDHVTVLHKLRSKPMPDSDHFKLDVLILSELHRRPAARCLEDIVVYDYTKGRKAPLKPFMFNKFMETWELQESAKQMYGERVTDLIARVRGLEKSSWDREGAEEDLGTAANP
ncbi:thioesterase-like superfamily-domain-containing protein, partial [Clohesyomyces aquaticus]